MNLRDQAYLNPYRKIDFAYGIRYVRGETLKDPQLISELDVMRIFYLLPSKYNIVMIERSRAFDSLC